MKNGQNLKFILLILIVLILMSIFAPWIAPLDPNEINMSVRNQLPGSQYLLGTDNMGRDVFSRLIYGGRMALLISFTATSLSMIIGILLGSIAGWYNGWIDNTLQIIMNIFQGLPGLSICIAIVGVLGTKNSSIFIALTLASWSGVARIVRSQVMSIKNNQYIEASRIYLPSSIYLISFHILPILLPTLIVLTMNRMGRMILSVASLSFLGVGLQPPTPDWGVMIQDGRQYFGQQPWMILSPSIMIFISSFSLTLLGEKLRDRWDIYDEKSKGKIW